MRARNLLLALGILAFALVLMLIISSKASAKESDNLQIADGSLVTDELSAVAESGHQITTPSLKPDLAITELKTPGNIKEKDIVAITVKLENLGSGSASNIVTSFYVDGKYIESKETKFMSGSPSGERRLNSNKKECSEKMLVFNWVAQQYGEYLLSFYADSSNAVEELDETNNYYTVTVLVKPTNDYGVSDTAVPTTANIVSSIAGIACAVSLLALLAFALDRYKFYWLISPLYVKLKREKLLDQFTRGRIYGYLESHPGAHYSMIKNALGLNNSTLTYHLHTLEREEYIKSRKEGNLRCFYLTSANTEQKNGLSKFQNRILETVSSYPGITQKQLLEILGNTTTQQALNYNVKILTNLNALRVVRKGKETYLFTTTYAAN